MEQVQVEVRPQNPTLLTGIVVGRWLQVDFFRAEDLAVHKLLFNKQLFGWPIIILGTSSIFIKNV